MSPILELDSCDDLRLHLANIHNKQCVEQLTQQPVIVNIETVSYMLSDDTSTLDSYILDRYFSRNGLSKPVASEQRREQGLLTLLFPSDSNNTQFHQIISVISEVRRFLAETIFHLEEHYPASESTINSIAKASCMNALAQSDNIFSFVNRSGAKAFYEGLNALGISAKMCQPTREEILEYHGGAPLPEKPYHLTLTIYDQNSAANFGKLLDIASDLQRGMDLSRN